LGLILWREQIKTCEKTIKNQNGQQHNANKNKRKKLLFLKKISSTISTAILCLVFVGFNHLTWKTYGKI
jgi:hypothetical protein